MEAGYHFTLGNLSWRSTPDDRLEFVNYFAWMREKYDNSNPTNLPLGGGYYGEWGWNGTATWVQIAAGGGYSTQFILLSAGGATKAILDFRNETGAPPPGKGTSRRPQNGRLFRLSFGALMAGTYSHAFICDATQHESLLGVHFRPGGAYPFLGSPAIELTDSHLDLYDLWARPALEFRERLCAAKAACDQFQLEDPDGNPVELFEPAR